MAIVTQDRRGGMTETVNTTFKLEVSDFPAFGVVAVFMRETLSEVPTYEITVNDQATKLESLIGQQADLTFLVDETEVEKPRKFSGLVTSGQRYLDASGTPYLRLEVRPKLAVLGLSHHSAIYQNKTSTDIVRAVLDRNGLAKLKIDGTKSKVKRDTVIQYDENDLTFCQRLLAEEGLTFWVEDVEGAATMVVHDARRPFSGIWTKIELSDAHAPKGQYRVADSLQLQRDLRPDKVELTAYNPAKADIAVSGAVSSSDAHTPESPMILEYRAMPVGDLKQAELDILKDATQRSEWTLTGTCRHPAMYLGQELDIKSDGNAELADIYVVVSLSFTMAGGNALSCDFTALPKHLHPVPRQIPKPRIAGVHNAIVVGKSNGDPACDNQGRVNVRFFWDKASSDSGFIRVSEPFAGNGYGAQFIPRAGHEVLVSFLHGDPDAPVITGQIYTERSEAPFVGKDTTSSGFRTQIDGEPNELEFDDRKGAEKFRILAGRDYEMVANRNSNTKILEHETTEIGGSSTLNITGDFTIKTDGHKEVTAQQRSVDVSGDDKVDAENITLTGKTSITLKVGQSSIKLTSSGVVINAPTVEIKGKSKIDLNSSGALALAGLTAELEAKTALDLKGLNINAKADVMFKAQGTMAEMSGSAMLTLKGGVVMIN